MRNRKNTIDLFLHSRNENVAMFPELGRCFTFPVTMIVVFGRRFRGPSIEFENKMLIQGDRLVVQTSELLS